MEGVHSRDKAETSGAGMGRGQGERPVEGSCELKKMGRSHGEESEMYFRCSGKPRARFKQRIVMI